MLYMLLLLFVLLIFTLQQFYLKNLLQSNIKINLQKKLNYQILTCICVLSENVVTLVSKVLIRSIDFLQVYIIIKEIYVPYTVEDSQ